MTAGSFLEDRGDKIVWEPNVKLGEVTTKLGHLVIVEEMIAEVTKWWFIYLWRMHIPLTIKCFSWLVLNEKILVLENMKLRGFSRPSFCHLCKKDTEHVLKFFSIASSSIWFGMRWED